MAKAYKRRNRRYRRKVYKPKEDNFTKVANVARTAFGIAKRVYRLVNSEMHRNELTGASINPTYNGSIVNLTNISQGDTDLTRTGLSIKLQTLRMRGNVAPSENASAPLYQQARMIIFRGKQENGVAYTASDLLATTGSFYAPNSLKNWTERFRTQVLYDKTYNLVGKSSTGPLANIPFDIKLKLTGHVNYSSGSNDIEDGGLYILFISNDLSWAPTIVYNYRLTFTDN